MDNLNYMGDQMNSEYKSTDKKSILIGTLKIFIPISLSITIITLVILQFMVISQKNEIKRDEWRVTETLLFGLDSDLQDTAINLAYLANQDELEKLWNSYGSIDGEILSELGSDYINISRQWALYDQVRLLDETGMELLRVNFNGGDPYVVDKKDLQNKSGRYYFEDAFNLYKGAVFISPLDLNIEQGAIEQPLKPMIRFATPVIDQFGKKRGVVLLNYFGEKLLQRFSSDVYTSTGSQLMLLNSDGLLVSRAKS